MKICVTAKGEGMEAQVDPRFGRCSYFVIVDTEKMEARSVENESKTAASGAGVAASQTVAEQQVDGVATGNVGPNAFQAINSAGMKVFVGAEGTVEETVQAFKNGELEEVEEPTTIGGHGKS